MIKILARSSDAMCNNIKLDQHVHRRGFPMRALGRLTLFICLAVSVGVSVPTMLAAPVCDPLPLGSLVAPGAGGNPPADAQIKSITDDPQPGSLSTQHLTDRVYSVSSTNNDIPGGQSAAATADGRTFAKNLGLDLSNVQAPKSDTEGADPQVKQLVEDANEYMASWNWVDQNGNPIGPPIDFVAAHLVHHLFNGNFGGLWNFTVTSGRTNKQMRSHGEKVAIHAMTQIANKYHRWGNEHKTFVAKSAGNPVRYYKPGIIYQTDADVTQSVFAYDNQPSITQQPWPNGRLMPDLSDEYKQQMASRVKTRVRFILHEYKEKAGSNGKSFEPTKQWHYMPPTIFSQVRPYIFDTKYFKKQGLPSQGTKELEGGLQVEVSGNGMEMTFTYLNQQ